MSDRIVRNRLGAAICFGLAMGLASPSSLPVARAQYAGGANGTIGRGSDFRQRMFDRPARVETAPVLVYVPAPTTALPAPTPASVAANERFDRAEARRPELALTLPALARRNPYLAYHRGWVHGYWTARIADSRLRLMAGVDGAEATSWHGPTPRPGMGLGWGIPAWFIGPMVYSWGYRSYQNPFYGEETPAGPLLSRFEDYSHPINVQNPPPTDTLVNAAHVRFREARAAFRREDYPRALRLTDEALGLVPDDPIIHQFRSLAFFSLRRYDEAAAAVHAVLAVEPGWDWTTTITLYANPETYTRQLRQLEAFSDEHPGSAQAHFLLAYHYLGTGYINQAVGQWERVRDVRPDDKISAGLIQALQPSRSSEADLSAGIAATAEAAGTPGAASPKKPGKLEGAWLARPVPGTVVTLVFEPEGGVICRVRQAGQDREFSGYAIVERTTLTLTQDQDNALVGTVSWKDEDHFNFRLVARWPGDPGLSFEKSR